MPTYNIKCRECETYEVISCSISEFQYSNKNKFENINCKKCGESNFIRIYDTISSKISRSSYEIVEKMKEEARSIVEKVRSGDQHAIRDVYGEGE